MLPTTQFNELAILENLLPWIRIESPTTSVAGVNRMMDLAQTDLIDLGARVDRLPGTGGFGDTVIGRIAAADAAAGPGVLILSHLDTIHLEGTLAGRLALRRDGDRYYGPGIYDMKGGVRLAFEALRVLRRTAQAPRLPITFLLVPDEEVGSPTSRARIEDEARRHKYVLVTEPCKDGTVVTGRHGFKRFKIHITGRPAHAGATNRLGRSAIRAMSDIVQRIERMTDFERGMTFSVGLISGGTFVNVMPIECRAEVLAVAPTPAIFDEISERMHALESESDGIRVSVENGPVRPIWPPHRPTMALFERAHTIAAEIGFELRHGSFGGGSDGNFTGALGIATLDGLGVDGGGAHTFEEHLLVSSLVPRCRLFAELLCRLD